MGTVRPIGDGYGYGYGDGDGYGYGYGYGSGYGSGDGDGEKIGEINGKVATVARPWGIVRVGCQFHSIDHWREHWREIAKANSVSISEAEVDRLLKAAEGCAS